MIRASLVDMDGILYDSMPMHARAWHALAGEMGMDIDADEFYRYEGMTGEATINLLAERELGKRFSPEEARELYGKKSLYFTRQGLPPVMPGAAEAMRWLTEKGVKCVLVTGSGQLSLIDRLQADFPGVFNIGLMVTSRNVRNGKPDPEPYLKGAELAGVRPEECIAIDNAPLGVQSASRSGAFTIGVSTGPLPALSLEEAGADVVCGSMKECLTFLQNNLDYL